MWSRAVRRGLSDTGENKARQSMLSPGTTLADFTGTMMQPCCGMRTSIGLTCLCCLPLCLGLCSTGAACTVWEAALEDLMPYLLENPGVLDALCCRAQRQREDLAATIAVNRAAAEAVAGGTFGLDPAPPQPPAGGWPQPGEAAAAEAGGGAQAGDSGSVDGSGAGGACLWTVSSAGVSANPSATQLPAAAAAAGENAVGAAEPAPDNAVADGPSGPVAGGAAAATPDGECQGRRVGAPEHASAWLQVQGCCATHSCSTQSQAWLRGHLLFSCPATSAACHAAHPVQSTA